MVGAVAAIAKVEPLTSARSLRGPFDYRLPSEMADVGIGSMLVIPFGRRRILGVVVDVASRSELAPERLVEPISALEEGTPADLVTLALWMAEEYCSTPARALALVLPPGSGTGRRGAPGATSRALLAATLTSGGREALVARDGATRLTGRQRHTLEALREGPKMVVELARDGGVDHASLRRLATRGLVSLEPMRHERRPAAVELGASLRPQAAKPRVTATGDQERALAPVLAAIEQRRHERLLLHGVTGSGKTEVYLRAAAAALEQGRSVIVLVPEIALTPQTVGRFRERFGDLVAVLHSKLGLGERYDEWRRLRRGEARVCIGPRSAVFAPLADVGLIVVDEEHDSAYKQESDPRYDARRVAEMRAEAAAAVLLCGSATPRPESWLGTTRLDLPRRVDGARLPPVELLDMRRLRHPLHPVTREALEDVRRRGAKAIVLVNRRGWAPFVVCRECGWTAMCPRCDVTLTLHRHEHAGGSERLLCHHCAHTKALPKACPECRSTAVARHGAGTQRLEAELAQTLAPLPVFRLDGDVARAKGGIANELRRFAEATAGVLVGTQMVAQGHDFPEVELAVVQDADATLRFPDFRSEERTFSLVAQLAGRSGRSRRGGKVLVQTMCPDARALRYAAGHDAAAFLEEELERRRALDYPPFSSLIRVVTAASGQEAADKALSAVRAGIELPGVEVLGPAPLFRLKERARSMLLVKTQSRAPAVRAVGAAVQRTAAAQSSRAVSFAVDVDPQ